MFRQKYLIPYLIASHLIGALLLYNFFHEAHSKEGLVSLTPFIEKTWSDYIVRSKTMNEEQKFLFFGNSITSSMSLETHFNGINFGISGETIANAKTKIPLLQNLENKTIVLSYGINDLFQQNDHLVKDYEELLISLPKTNPIFVTSILPINEDVFNKISDLQFRNKTIEQSNEQLKELCLKFANVHFVEIGTQLKNEQKQLHIKWDQGDGLHLNPQGSFEWIKTLKENIASTHLIHHR